MCLWETTEPGVRRAEVKAWKNELAAVKAGQLLQLGVDNEKPQTHLLS